MTYYKRPTSKVRLDKQFNPFLKPKVHILSEELRNASRKNLEEATMPASKAARRLAYGPGLDGGDMPMNPEAKPKKGVPPMAKKPAAKPKGKKGK